MTTHPLTRDEIDVLNYYLARLQGQLQDDHPMRVHIAHVRAQAMYVRSLAEDDQRVERGNLRLLDEIESPMFP